jgi:hypothetical protein
MTDFREQNLAGARFEDGDLRGAAFTRVRLNEGWEHRLYAERDLTRLEKEN